MHISIVTSSGLVSVYDAAPLSKESRVVSGMLGAGPLQYKVILDL